jgi:K+-sensing histidine kinase KdpD
MQLGYELVKEQLFFRREMIERVDWLIRLRWIAVGAGIAAVWAVYLFLDPDLPVFSLNLILLFILLYNGFFYAFLSRLKFSEIHGTKRFTLFANAQITMDLFSLFLLIYFTGGIYSPVLIFVIFHIILAGILLTPLNCFLYALIVLSAIFGFILFQQAGWMPAYQSAFLESPLFPYARKFPNLFILCLMYLAAILITSFLITTIKLSLRTKGRELLQVSKELDTSNSKLTALYEMVKGMGHCSDLQALLNLATQNASKIMGVKGCSIKLLDDQRKTLRFASTYGLSENYSAKGSINVAKSPINRKIIEGSFYAIAKIDEKDYFQYPEDIRKEGIASMMCLPLKVEKMVLGVLCIYTGTAKTFPENDIEFFSLMAELTALAIENLRTNLNRTWFLQKVAHQLRSPMNAVLSMLKALRKAFFGPLDPGQIDIVLRCEKRIKILEDLIDDLLKIGMDRADVNTTAMVSVNMKDVLKGLQETYRSQAAENEIEITFELEETLPPVMATEKLIDELSINLISNAIKYTPAGGKIGILLTRESQDLVRFEVNDTGIGIPEGEISRLFTEFFRAENAKAITEEGTGLGLVIVKECLNRLRGTISVESCEGKGTRFVCLIPVNPA